MTLNRKLSSSLQPDLWNAEDYAKNSSIQLQLSLELIEKLNLQGNEHLLDLGCGDGKITCQIARTLKQGKVVGIDASQNAIALAQQTYPSQKYPNLQFQTMDARNINLARKFDIVFSNAALHWIEDHLSVLHCVRRHLNPQGKILFQMGGKGNVEAIITIIEELAEQPKWKRYFPELPCPYSFYDIDDYLEWLPKTGFQPQRVELLEKETQHQGIEGFKGWLRTTWFPYTHQVPESLRDDFVDAIAKNYVQQFPCCDRETISVEMIRLEVEAFCKLE